MSTIQSLGIGSGLKIDEIVSALVDAEKVPKEQSINRKEEITNAKISAYGEIKSRLSSFQTAAASLRSSSNFSQKEVTTSDASAFTATANSIAENANYTVSVNQLAQAQSLASGSFESVSDIIGTGTLTVKFGETTIETAPPSYNFAQDPSAPEQTITIDSSNNTLSSLKDHINNNEYGMSASIINDGNGYRLVLSAESGAKNSLQISVANDGDGVDGDNAGLSQLTMDNSAQFLTQNVAAQDASLSINGIPITSESNTVSNAVNGLTLELLSETTSPKSVKIESQTSQIKEQVTALVESYNEFISYTSELTAFSGSTGEASLLLGDPTVRTMVSQVRQTMFSQVSGVSSGLQALSNIGILSTQANGTLEFDEAKFDAALLESGDEFQALFATAGSTSDSNIQFVSGSSLTKEGSYDVKISQLATKGSFGGNPVLPDFGAGGSITINSDNDNFEIRLDGNSSGPITLAAGTYNSGAALASVIQNSINESSNLRSKGSKVTVTYDPAGNNFKFESSTYGSTSGVVFTNVDSNMALELGLFAGAGISGLNVEGTINGEIGTGSGQFLSINSGDAKGLKIGVLGGLASPGGANRGSVTFSRGIADNLDTLLDSFLKTDGGFLSTRLDGLDDSLARIEADREALTYTMKRFETRLLAQFNSIDSVVGQLNNLSSFLTNALATLPGAPKKD